MKLKPLCEQPCNCKKRGYSGRLGLNFTFDSSRHVEVCVGLCQTAFQFCHLSIFALRKRYWRSTCIYIIIIIYLNDSS